MAEKVQQQYNASSISILEGLEVHAIVNAANNSLLGGVLF